MRYARDLREASGPSTWRPTPTSYDRRAGRLRAEHPGWTAFPSAARRALPRRELLVTHGGRAEDDLGRWTPVCRALCATCPIFDGHGRHIGTPDLLDPVAGVVGEYDGALHLAGEQRARDVRRAEAFRQSASSLHDALLDAGADRRQDVAAAAGPAPSAGRAPGPVGPCTPWWIHTATGVRPSAGDAPTATLVAAARARRLTPYDARRVPDVRAHRTGAHTPG